MALENLRQSGVDTYLRRRGFRPSVILGLPCIIMNVAFSFRPYSQSAEYYLYLSVIPAILFSLYIGRRRSLRWSKRKDVRALVWEADILGVAIPSYGYWRHARNFWRNGRRITALGYVCVALYLTSIFIAVTSGLGGLLLMRFSGAAAATARLRHEVIAARLGEPGSADVLLNDLDDLAAQRFAAGRALDAAHGEVEEAEKKHAQMRLLVDEAEKQMIHLRKLQKLEPGDQAVISEILETKRGIAATMIGIDQKISSDAAAVDRKNMKLWWLALILSIPLNILATLLTIRLGISN